jgi:hypothetical protein
VGECPVKWEPGPNFEKVRPCRLLPTWPELPSFHFPVSHQATAPALIRVGLDGSLPPGKFHNEDNPGRVPAAPPRSIRDFVHSSRNVVTLLHNHSRIERRHRYTTATPPSPRIRWSTHSPSERCLPSSIIRSLIRHRVSMRFMALPV